MRFAPHASLFAKRFRRDAMLRRCRLQRIGYKKNDLSWLNMMRQNRRMVARKPLDRGMPTPSDEGPQALTNGAVYNSRRTGQILEATEAKAMMEENVARRRERAMAGASHDRYNAIATYASPETDAERNMSEAINARDLQLGHDNALEETSRTPYTTRLHQARQRAQMGFERFVMNHSSKPNGRELRKASVALERFDDADERAKTLQEKLTEEHGIYAEHRLDAYMLNDESTFPSWVRYTTASLRSKVMYDGLGLNEDDEVLRQNLARMPMTERVQEWERLKAARKYRLAHEERVTPGELRRMRKGTRKYHALERKRIARETLVRRIAQGRPELEVVAPTGDVDFSRRVALVARHVEAGVPTKGEWPLTERNLVQAERRKLKENFQQGAPHRMKDVNPQIKAALAQLADRERPMKRIAKREYSDRINAVLNGDQNERGHSFTRMNRHIRQKGRTAPLENKAEWELERKLEPMQKAWSGQTTIPTRMWNWTATYQFDRKAHTTTTEEMIGLSRGLNRTP